MMKASIWFVFTCSNGLELGHSIVRAFLLRVSTRPTVFDLFMLQIRRAVIMRTYYKQCTRNDFINSEMILLLWSEMILLLWSEMILLLWSLVIMHLCTL